MHTDAVLGRDFVIERRLREGTFSDLFAALDTRTRQRVAVKVGRPNVDFDAGERLKREARAGLRIRSDHVAHVVDVGETDDGRPFLVLELLEGETLLDRLKRNGPMPLRDLHTIGAGLWQSLVDCHSADVIHGNVKSSNVFIERVSDKERVRLVDLGFAGLPGSEPSWKLASFARIQTATEALHAWCEVPRNS